VSENLQTCQWKSQGRKKCGMPAKYALGHPEETPVPICSLHYSRASTLGWPVRKIKKNIKTKAGRPAERKL
jgi:hypothetical protein